ncbi:PREDICTED: uncharacterized protein LOC107068043 [Polistes dominula]|uniref:Uncharacterized protein LOC107068043 n=1 Tax=Polistes dominula TaxID=743375 RepID=A0ABM1IH44_POLDO|nr:PREDICTED: uncharacterized protein LOC107068043 [Polistes dominula]XP_015179532.1 PREDICTED: uncharacterized protein LOC107068043 [Polistes dominula]
MLHRSASSRRRRASRNVTNSNHPVGASSTTTATTTTAATIAVNRGRRASVATEKPDLLTQINPCGTMERQKSPRGSVVPNIALDVQNDLLEEGSGRRILPNLDYGGSRNNLTIAEIGRSPRNSLIPDDYCRSPRGSLIPDVGRSPRNSLVPEISRSARNSLTPDTPHSPRHSLVPDLAYNRSPRNSLVPLGGSRTSLMAENGTSGHLNRSPRHSLVPDSNRSPRGSVANLEFDRSPRGSICPEMMRTGRGGASGGGGVGGSTTPLEIDRSPRGSLSSECANQSPRGSIAPDPNRSPRGSIAPDPNRSPRGSICPESNRSPRGSIVTHEQTNRSPRGSIVVNDLERHSSSRNIIAGNDEENRSPRGSIAPECIDRSPRGSLGGGGLDRRTTKSNLIVQDPRRASADQGTVRSRSSSPYRQKDTNCSSVRSAGNGAQINHAYGGSSWTESRRASSSVSQFSGDESRRLCAGIIKIPVKGTSETANLGVATYGSVVFQLKDAHLEANGTCDFVFRALRVISKTMIVTICLAILSTMPILMFILGLQFIKDCPREPHIPVYMVVGGTLGTVRMFWSLYSQIRSRRPEALTVPNTRSYVSPMKLASITLSCFLVGWFVLGNYWILSIEWPEYTPLLYDPDRWCHRTLYIFSLVHLCIVYVVIALSILLSLGLAFCRIFACPWPERYK